MLSKRKQDLVFTYMVEDWARQNNLHGSQKCLCSDAEKNITVFECSLSILSKVRYRNQLEKKCNLWHNSISNECF